MCGLQLDPKTPQNLEELVAAANKIPILTMGQSQFTSHSKTELSIILKNYVIPDLVSDETISRQNQDTYNRLRDVVVFTTNYIFVVAKQFSTRGFVLDSNNTKIAVGNDGMFAVVDDSDDFKTFHYVLTLFGKYKKAKLHNSVASFYTMRTFWVLQKNFFTNIFSTGLSSLVETGIYQRWTANVWINRPQLQSYGQFREMGRRAKIHQLGLMSYWGRRPRH